MGAYFFAMTTVAANNDRIPLESVTSIIWDSITIGGEQKMKNGIVESVPKAYRPVAMIGANVVFKVYASNWPLWNQGIDTVMQLKGLEHTKNLAFYSLTDPMCRPEMMQECLDSW